MKYTIYKDKLDKKQQSYLINIIKNLEYDENIFEGKYGEIIYDERNKDIDSNLLKAISMMCQALTLDQDFNTIIVKKFEVGNYVITHRDSRNTVGKSITIVVGDFEESRYRFDGKVEYISPGDILTQDCTNGYSMGPEYCMYPLKDGIKYAITICTILKENSV